MDVKTKKNKSDDKNGSQRYAQANKNIRPNRKVLFIEHVEYAVGKNFNGSTRCVRQSF